MRISLSTGMLNDAFLNYTFKINHGTLKSR